MTADTAVRQASVGTSLRRKEDSRLVTGRTTWTDNINLPGLLYMAILRSPMAHARITRIDVSPALTRPGVVAAFSANEIGDKHADEHQHDHEAGDPARGPCDDPADHAHVALRRPAKSTVEPAEQAVG